MHARRRWRFISWTALGVAVASVVACGATWDRNAWSDGWPRFAGIHRGGLVILSSAWDRPPPGVEAWTYDVLVGQTPGWRPSIVRLGNRYSVRGVRWGRPLVGVHLPLWTLAPPTIVLAWVARRRGRTRDGLCPCGYDLAGIRGPCPECGHARPSPT